MRQFFLLAVGIWVFVSSAAKGAILHYAGVALEQPRYQEHIAPIKRGEKKKTREEKEVYLGLIELSRYEIHLVFPTVAKFLNLVTLHPSVSNHITSCLDLKMPELIDFLRLKYNHKDQHQNFVSLEDITPYLRRAKSDPSYCFVNDQAYPIAAYQDYLELAESRWHAKEVGKGTKEFLIAALRFLDYYESLGSLFRAKSKHSLILGSSDRHHFKHLAELKQFETDSNPEILMSWQRAHDLSELRHGHHAWHESLAAINNAHKKKMAEIPDSLSRRNIVLTKRQKLFQNLIKGEYERRDLVLYESIPRILDRIKLAARKATTFYIHNLTDDLADNIEDHRFNLTLAGIEPMDKEHYLAYRFAKGSDGFLTISITLAGELAAPLTGGLSGVVSNLSVTGINGFFSFVVSIIRKQKLMPAIERAMLRTLISGISNMIPYVGDINDYISGMSELNLATGIDQDIRNVFRKEKRSKFVAPEAIGQALVLRLLRERVEWVESLLTKGRELYRKNPMKEKERIYFLGILKNLTDVHRELVSRSLKATTRYEYLLAKGKIPQAMLLNVAFHYYQDVKKNQALFNLRK